MLIGGDGDDRLLGGADDDVLNGGPGDDVLIGGETVIDGIVANRTRLARHARTVNGNTVIDLGGGKRLTVPGKTVAELG